MPITTRITNMFGCRHPLQQAGMGGMVTPALALAVASAGGIGMLSGTGSRFALAAQLDAVPPGAAVGVSFLVPFLEREAVSEAARRCPLVELFWGEPDPALVDLVHEGGARAGWQVGSAEEARAAEDAGCDVVVAQGHEAGGHVRGTVGLLPLLDEVREVTRIPVIAAGGVGTGRGMAAALTAGADAVRLGTRFVATAESEAHPAYVEALIAAGADDTEVTTAFGEGWPDAPHRVLRSSIEAGNRLGPSHVWSPAWPSARATGAVGAHALYAGQSVGAIRARLPAGDVVAELVEEAEALLLRGRPGAASSTGC